MTAVDLTDKTYGHAAVLSRTHHAIATIAEQYMDLAPSYTADENALICSALNKLNDIAADLYALDAAVGERLGDDVTLAATTRYPLLGGVR